MSASASMQSGRGHTTHRPWTRALVRAGGVVVLLYSAGGVVDLDVLLLGEVIGGEDETG